MRIVIILSLVLLAPAVKAQDSLFIKDYSDKFILISRLGLRGQAFQYRADGLNTTLDYAPNVAASYSLSISYKWLGLGVGFKIPVSEINDGRGETEILDFAVNSFGRKVGFDAFYLDYSGFYLSNTRRSLGGLINGAPFYLRPDISNSVYGGNAYYVFNHEQFSYRSVYTFSEQQLRTAGSWLVQINVANFQTRADSAFLPSQLLGNLTDPELGEITYFRILQGGALGGYGLNLVVKKKFYGSASILAGAALIDYKATGANGQIDRGYRISERAVLRGGVGYSSEKWFWGANTSLDAYNFRYNKSLQISFFVAQFRFYLGYRLNWKPF